MSQSLLCKNDFRNFINKNLSRIFGWICFSAVGEVERGKCSMLKNEIISTGKRKKTVWRVVKTDPCYYLQQTMVGKTIVKSIDKCSSVSISSLSNEMNEYFKHKQKEKEEVKVETVYKSTRKSIETIT